MYCISSVATLDLHLPRACCSIAVLVATINPKDRIRVLLANPTTYQQELYRLYKSRPAVRRPFRFTGRNNSRNSAAHQTSLPETPTRSRTNSLSTICSWQSVRQVFTVSDKGRGGILHVKRAVHIGHVKLRGRLSRRRLSKNITLFTPLKSTNTRPPWFGTSCRLIDRTWST